jgi:NAD(P)H-nitrite reductase large subunit
VFNPSDASFLVCEQREADRYERVVCRDGRVVGAVLFGDVSLAGRIKDAVEGQRHVRELPDLVERFPGLAAYGG